MRTFLLSAIALMAGLGTALGDDQDNRRSNDPPPAGSNQNSNQPAAPAQNYRAKQIIGAKVSLDGDRSAGTVDDIVFGDNGSIEYLVVINDEHRMVTVPWEAARFSAEQRTAVVHIAPERFREIPTYTAEQYPAYWTPTYRTQIYKYYGLTPRQERRILRERRRD